MNFRSLEEKIKQENHEKSQYETEIVEMKANANTIQEQLNEVLSEIALYKQDKEIDRKNERLNELKKIFGEGVVSYAYKFDCRRLKLFNFYKNSWAGWLICVNQTMSVLTWPLQK